MSYEWPSRLWPHQRRGCQEIVDAIARGERRIVCTAPTGGGKSQMMAELILRASSEWQKSVLYTHRRLLLSQTSRVLDDNGIEHALRAAGHKPSLLRDVQLCMTQSEYNAVFRKERHGLHRADLVETDELHGQGGEMIRLIHDQHYQQGAAIVGFTATPLDLEGEWDRLVIAGTNSELRKCGALVPAIVYAPDTPDLRHIRNYQIGVDLSDTDNAAAILRPGILGRVSEHWLRLNPDRLPTLLFAPDVAGSRFFATELSKMGIRASHIDAKQILHRGKLIDSTDENRERILDMTKTGEIEILCNRWVLREGINLPHIACGILAAVFGSLKTYLQIVGRILRAYPGMDSVTLIDHGGNAVRHGSPNADREWELGMTSAVEAGKRIEALRQNQELEPIRCPKCGMMRLSGAACIPSPPGCGFICSKRSRLVVQIDGSLKLIEGPSFPPRKVSIKSDTQATWERYFFGARRSGRTVNQALGFMYSQEHYEPPRDLPYMPLNLADFYEPISSIWPQGTPFPHDRLRPKPFVKKQEKLF